MTTSKLLWGTTWRGGVWGVLAGLILGAIYGPLLILILAIIDIVNKTSSNDNLGEVAGFALLGVIFGAIFGAPIGLFVGALNGLFIGILTRIFFTPLKNKSMYRWGIAVLSALFTSVTAWLGLAVLFIVIGSVLDANVLLLAITIPAFIGGIVPHLLAFSLRDGTKRRARNDNTKINHRHRSHPRAQHLHRRGALTR